MERKSSHTTMTGISLLLALGISGCLRQEYVPPAGLNRQTGAQLNIGPLRPLKNKYERLNVDAWITRDDPCAEGERLGSFNLQKTPHQSFVAPAGRGIEIYAQWSPAPSNAAVIATVVTLAVAPAAAAVVGTALANRDGCLVALSFVPEVGKEYEYLFQEPADDRICRTSVLETYRDEKGMRRQRPVAVQKPRECSRQRKNEQRRESASPAH